MLFLLKLKFTKIPLPQLHFQWMVLVKDGAFYKDGLFFFFYFFLFPSKRLIILKLKKSEKTFKFFFTRNLNVHQVSLYQQKKQRNPTKKQQQLNWLRPFEEGTKNLLMWFVSWMKKDWKSCLEIITFHFVIRHWDKP